jgi:hypothetical protein
MTATEVTPKSPSVPLFQKGEFSPSGLNPSLEKHAPSAVEGRRRGDFWAERGGNYLANFWVSHGLVDDAKGLFAAFSNRSRHLVSTMRRSSELNTLLFGN